MNDEAIIELFWRRDEAAIEESRCVYGAYCRAVAMNVLNSLSDAEELARRFCAIVLRP